MPEGQYRVEVRFSAEAPWEDAPGFTSTRDRAFTLMQLGRFDSNGGIWRITYGDEVIYEDDPHPPKLPLARRILRFLFPWM